jgi:hypothetical protein
MWPIKPKFKQFLPGRDDYSRYRVVRPKFLLFGKVIWASAPSAKAVGDGPFGRVPQNPFYAASASAPLIINPRGPADTCTVSPSFTPPSRISPASGFCRLRWITRFSGRAP